MQDNTQQTLAAMHWTFSDWFTGTPPRPGWFAASAERNTERRAHWSGTAWSAQVDEAASDDDFTAALATPMHPALAARVEWCGVTEDSYRSLVAALALNPA